MFDVKGIIGDIRSLYTIIILTIYGLTHILQTYIFSLRFKIPSSGFAIITGWNIITSKYPFIID